MSEQVIRHRGAGRDENGKLISAANTPLWALEIAPGGGARNVALARDGETIACTVYFPPGVDVKNSDELSVRNERFTVIVNDWRSGGLGGLEVLCTRGHG